MTQNTLRSEVEVTGVGLRGGREIHVRLEPAAEHTGIVFRSGGVDIPATVEHVVDTTLATTIGRAGVRVALVEHLLAALLASEIDNVRVTVSGDELPILDGTSLGWLGALARAGTLRQAAPVSTWTVSAPVTVASGQSRATLHPASALSLDISVEFDHAAIGAQRWVGSPAAFGTDLAWARTFGFRRDAERLQALGIVKGASLDNTLVFEESGPMNPGGLRAPDEVVRHKALDALGDLALRPGRPLVRLEAHRGGHALHHALLGALR